MIKRAFAFLFLLSARLLSQDTISVLFKTGYFKIENKEIEKLDLIPVTFELNDLDSVHFVGMADSVGKFESNLKLSEKRVVQVEKFCRKFIPATIPVRVGASGETNQNKLEFNRRVNIILYFKTKRRETIESADNDTSAVNTTSVTTCYDIDYDLLHHCHLRLITKGKKEFIVIESQVTEWKKLEKLFYADINKSGKIIVRPLKWKDVTTGRFWWARSRNTALVLKESFRKFKIFRKHPLPCGECSETFEVNKPLSKVDTCFQTDYFLMHNLQVKVPLFPRSWVRVRVPREYVDISCDYFIGCHKDWKLKWEERSGRKNQKYFFTKLPVRIFYLENITRYTDCCTYKPEPSECDKGIIGVCPLSPPDKALMIILEPGYNYQLKTHLPYFMLGLGKNWDKGLFALLSGIDINHNWYSTLRYQYYYLSFPFKSSVISWQSPGSALTIERYGRLYIGSELNALITQSTNYISQNLHLGLALVNYKYRAFFQRAFIQYSVNVDYSGNYSSKTIFPMLQAGIDCKLFHF
ncbi:MAG TPA: hypothetical protein VNZ49_08090 [Bacteroidia bacterium]|jgi:hypothetical protein|nr:hypothetical protein [Bacteroidia bacterium]